jgi:hypothetical protein
VTPVADTPEDSRRRITNYLKLQEPEVQEAYQLALAGELQQWALESAHFCSKLDEGRMSDLAIQEGLDIIYTSLTDHILHAVSATIPSKMVGPDCRSWWDEEIQELVDTRSEAYVALRRHADTLGEIPLLSDETYNLLWNKYVQLRKQVHSLASRKKTQQWQTLLSKLEGDFSSDRNHFFSEIDKIRRKHSPQQCSLQSVRLTNNTCYDCAWLSLTALSTVTCNLWL